MTRDEVIDAMAAEHMPEVVAKAVCHDAFDHFVANMASMPEGLCDLDLCLAWTFFRDGWDAAA